MFTLTEGGFFFTDYMIFGILTVGSCLGGFYYSAQASKKKAIMDTSDYLLGGKTLSTVPVAMSLIASYVSGVTILGTPAEIYNYGTQYWLIVFGIILSCITVDMVYIPVFCKLQLFSSYEYLELRFNRHVRAVASLLFLFDEIMFLPMVIWIPALAFNQLTGVNVFVVAIVTVFIGGVYTALGGLKAVIWTDMVQTTVMFIGTFLVTVAGTIAVGGVSTVLTTARQSGRLSFDNWNLSPYERQTGWGSVIGGFLYWTCFNSVNQTMVQRYISLPKRKNAHNAMAMFCAGAVFAMSLCVWNGLVAWTAWVTTGCDSRGEPLVNDRLLPSFVTWVASTENMPGLSGVFLSGVFGAGLSSLSVVLNACTLVVIEDLLRAWLQIDMKPITEGVIARLSAAGLAIISVLMLLVIRQLGGILAVGTALSAIASSVSCGIFTLGMVCWWVGPKGAIAGGVCGALATGTISFGSQAATMAGLRYPPLDFSASCGNSSSSTPSIPSLDPETVFPLFRISYLWIAPVGLLTTVAVGAVVGYIFDDALTDKMDAELFTPGVWRFLPKEATQNAGTVRKKLNEIMRARQPMRPLIAHNAH